MKSLADELGKSEATVKTMRTLADLIPPLAAMLDAGTLNQTKPQGSRTAQAGDA